MVVDEDTRQLWFLVVIGFGLMALLWPTVPQLMYVLVALPVLWWLRPIRW